MLDLSQHQGLEHLTLEDPGVGEVRGVSLCQNMDKLEKVELNYVTLTHDQLESLATAGSLRTVNITELTCITHEDNRQDCYIQLDYSQYVSFEKIRESWRQCLDIRITSWPSSCMETLDLRRVDISHCDTFCTNLDVGNVSNIYLENITLTHDQLGGMMESLATAGSLRAVDIRWLTCITHADNRQDCSMMLDLSQHQGLERLTLGTSGVGEVQGVSLCQNMDKLEKVELAGFCISAAALRQTLETLPGGHSVKVELGYYPPLRVRGAKETRKLLQEIKKQRRPWINVEYTGDECVVQMSNISNIGNHSRS